MDGAASPEEGAAVSAPEQEPVQTTDLLGLGESWADASEAPAEPSSHIPIEAEDPSEVEATLEEIAQDAQAWIEVKAEAGLDAEGNELAVDLEGAASGAPVTGEEAAASVLPPEVPELSSEPTVSVDEDRVTDLPELELHETNIHHSEELPIDFEETTAEGVAEIPTTVEGAASGAPDVSGVEHIDLDDDEDPGDVNRPFLGLLQSGRLSWELAPRQLRDLRNLEKRGEEKGADSNVQPVNRRRIGELTGEWWPVSCSSQRRSASEGIHHIDCPTLITHTLTLNKDSSFPDSQHSVAISQKTSCWFCVEKFSRITKSILITTATEVKGGKVLLRLGEITPWHLLQKLFHVLIRGTGLIHIKSSPDQHWLCLRLLRFNPHHQTIRHQVGSRP